MDFLYTACTLSGAGTNLKVGGGHRSGAKRRKKFLVVPLHFFGSKVQLVVLVSAIVMVSTVWSVYCSLFFYSLCPPLCYTLCSWHISVALRVYCSVMSYCVSDELSELNRI